MALVNGMYCYKPHDKAPGFIIADLSIKKDVFLQWLENEAPSDEYIKIQIKSNMNDPSKYHAALNDYVAGANNQDSQPNQQPQSFQPQEQNGFTPQGFQPSQPQQQNFGGEFDNYGPAPWEQDY